MGIFRFEWVSVEKITLKNMSVPSNKAELLAAIDQNFEKLWREIESISPTDASKKDLEGHAKNTKMSAHNLVAYLVGWELLVLKWIEKSEKGESIDFPETGFRWNELGLLAQKFYRDHQAEPFSELLKKLAATTSEIRQIIEYKTDCELYEMPFYDRWPLGKMIQLNTSSPFKNATIRLRKWRKTLKMH